MRLKSIITQLAMVVATLVVLAVAGLVLYTSRTTYQAVLHAEEQCMEIMVESAIDRMEADFVQLEANLRDISRHPAIQAAIDNPDDQNKAKAQDVMIEVMSHHPEFLVFYFFDTKGVIQFGISAPDKRITNLDISSRDYFRAIMDNKHRFVSDVGESKVDGRQFFSIVREVRAGDKLLGAMAVAVNWKEYKKNIIDSIHIGKEGYVFATNDKGEIITHPDPEMKFKTDVTTYDFMNVVLKEKRGFKQYSFKGRDKVMFFSQVPSTGWQLVGTAYESDLAAMAQRQRTILIIVGVLLFLALSTAIVLAARTLVVKPLTVMQEYTRKITRGDLKAELRGAFRHELADLASNLRDMVRELKDRLGFAQGVLDGLSMPCAIIDQDHNVSWINKEMVDIVGKDCPPGECVGLKAGSLFWDDDSRATLMDKALDQRTRLNEEMEYRNRHGETKAADITSTPFYDLDGQLLGAFASWYDLTALREQQRTIEETNKVIIQTAEQAMEVANRVADASAALATQIDQAVNGAELQRERTTVTAESMEQMNSTVLDVARNAAEAAGAADEAMTQSRSGSRVVEQVKASIGRVTEQTSGLQATMRELGSQADSIGNVISTINDIADQTNLLALNAAIEAARAGEAGRGFAVVADEVRKLAEKTMSATKEVELQISAIQKGVNKGVDAARIMNDSVREADELSVKAQNALVDITEVSEKTAATVNSIATAAEEQSAASDEITQSIEDITRVASETTEGMDQARAAVDEVKEQAERLNELMQRLGRG